MNIKLIWHTETHKVSDLLPYDKNPRKINDKQMSDLKRSLKKFNLAELPAMNLDHTLIAGHQRIKALQLLGRGEETIEIRVPNRQLSESEFKDYLITSNKSGGTFDFEGLSENFTMDELSLSGFENDELSDIFSSSLSVEDEATSDEVELKKIKKTSIKTGQMFQLGRHRLICGSSLDPRVVHKLMGSVRADMVNDDLPFNIGLSYNSGVGNKQSYGGTTNDSKTDEEYKLFVKTIMQNALSVTKKNAHVLFWCDERYVWLFQTIYKELGIDSKRLLIWLKNNASPTPTVAFNKVTEFCVYGTIGSPYLAKKVNTLNEIINPDMTTGNNLAEEVNIWMEKRLPVNQYNHPTEKSASLHTKALKRCTRIDDVVLDLTAGGGSILMACEQLNRIAYVCEMESIFCQLIINKFEKLSGIKAKKIHD